MTTTVGEHVHNNDIRSVLLDVESVLADTHKYLLNEHNEQFGTNYTREDITTWDWVNTEIGWDRFNRIIEKGWIEQTIEPTEENLGISVKQLTKRDNITVDVVTGRTGVETEMKSWLDDHDIEYNAFHSVSKSKATLDYDDYIDDNPTLADDLPVDKTQYLMLWPYNLTVQDYDHITPVTSVTEAVGKILQSE